MSAIDVRDVFRVHSTPEGDAAALQGLSFAVAEGEVVTVLGPSGAGKSTLLRLLAGVESPSSGTVRVFGESIAKLDGRRLADYRARTLGYLDQRYARALAPELSAREAIALQLGLRGASLAERRLRADELLERVGLVARGNHRPSELSGGERQRVALCAALAHRPRLFLADEPTGELDSNNADKVYVLIGELAREHGCTTVIVSHDPESTRIADRIVRIRDGRVSEEWGRDTGSSDTIVIGRGGWLRLPEELLLRAGIGDRAVARLSDGHLVVEPVAGSAPTAEPPAAGDPARTRLAAEPTRCEPVAVVEQLEKTHGATPVLRGLSASFAPGLMHVVTGPSGSGKTTLLHILAGLELADRGRVEVVGENLTPLSRPARAAIRRHSIAYVAQDGGLVPHLSAVENVELGLAIRGIARQPGESHRALELVGLADRASQRVERLSHGERARVAIARAVAARPVLLLADEPTARLDVANAVSVAGLLARLARETGAAVICATHDPLVVEQADHELHLG